MSDIIKTVQNAIEPIINGLGYEIVDIELVKKHEQKHLTVFIDIPKGITLDDCEKIHLAIDPKLDEINPLGDEPYVLNVSSPGLDRPFKKQRDFERNYGKEVEVKLYAPMKGKKLYEGVLKERTENTLTIQVKGEELKIENSKIAKVCPLVKF